MPNWFSSRGRISRRDYWLQAILPALGLYLLHLGYLTNFRAVVVHARWAMLLTPLMLPVLLVLGFRIRALTRRRFHDLGEAGPRHRSLAFHLAVTGLGILLAPVIFMIGYLGVIALLMSPRALEQAAPLIGGGIIAVVVLLAMRFLKLALRPGQGGDNEHGPDPLDRPPGGAPQKPGDTNSGNVMHTLMAEPVRPEPVRQKAQQPSIRFGRKPA